ncbi:hypothetical protein [Pyrobaculum aerophilum]|nr:hypothetical protein [Pyrobaculum aerophilum]
MAVTIVSAVADAISNMKYVENPTPVALKNSILLVKLSLAMV